MRLIFVILFIFSFAKTFAAPFKIDVTAKWEIVDNDLTKQTYTLNEESTSLGPMKSASFSRGARELENLPVPESKWNDWRTRMTRVIASVPDTANCEHPLLFRTSRKNEKPKEKVVCPNTLTKTEKETVHKLMTEISEHLYGP